jgi:hypothetical protein
MFAVGLGRNHRGFPGLCQWLEYPLIRIVAFVRNDDRHVERTQQDIGSVQVAGLAGREQKAGRIAEGIDGGMNLRAQPAFAASDRLVATVFF